MIRTAAALDRAAPVLLRWVPRATAMVIVNGEEYLTVKEAARVLGVKPATLYAYVSRGVLRSYRQGIKRQRLYRRTEVAGYDSVWVTHGSGRDSFLVLAAYGAATSRLGLGNGVVPIYPRHPVAMAQAALTLAELSGGRFRLGIGVRHRISMETPL